MVFRFLPWIPPLAFNSRQEKDTVEDLDHLVNIFKRTNSYHFNPGPLFRSHDLTQLQGSLGNVV